MGRKASASRSAEHEHLLQQTQSNMQLQGTSQLTSLLPFSFNGYQMNLTSLLSKPLIMHSKWILPDFAVINNSHVYSQISSPLTPHQGRRCMKMKMTDIIIPHSCQWIQKVRFKCIMDQMEMDPSVYECTV